MSMRMGLTTIVRASQLYFTGWVMRLSIHIGLLVPLCCRPAQGIEDGEGVGWGAESCMANVGGETASALCMVR